MCLFNVPLLLRHIRVLCVVGSKTVFEAFGLMRETNINSLILINSYKYIIGNCNLGLI